MSLSDVAFSFLCIAAIAIWGAILVRPKQLRTEVFWTLLVAGLVVAAFFGDGGGIDWTHTVFWATWVAIAIIFGLALLRAHTD